MAATESRTGFRLPWSTEEKANGQPADEPQPADRPADADASVSHAADDTTAVETTAPDAEALQVTSDGPSATSASETSTDAGTSEEASVQPTATPASAPRAADPAPKKPTKFLADLTRAMQAAAESSRASTMEQFLAEAKTHIESVHARTADEATELRKIADDDIVTIRDWSKAELARIREETERRITQRKADLDVELEEHAARIEGRVERVQSRVAAFESEMDRFFERLMSEDDPAEFAAKAENLPEPPPFDLDDDTDDDDTTARASASDATPTATATADEPAASADETGTTASAETEPETAPEATAEAGSAETDASSETIGEGESYAVQDDPAAVEAAMRAIEAAYKAAETGAEPPAEGTGAAEDAANDEIPADDPRLAALGLSPDLGAAEAEAAASAANTSDDEIPTIDDDKLAARLAGLVPEGSPAPTPRAPAPKAAATSQVVVTGLISVASIASFKRHLGRVSGVQSVGVSSGPDGEFVFKVAHAAEVNLADAIPTLPGFEARVTGTGDGVVNVSARDPESEG